MNLYSLTSKRPSNFETKLRKIIQSRPVVLNNPYNFTNIMELCATAFNVEANDVTRLNKKGKMSRKREMAYTRFAVMYFMRANTLLSLRKIGWKFAKSGHKLDHSTIIHGLKCAKRLMHSRYGSIDFKEPFEQVEKILKEQYEEYEKR